MADGSTQTDRLSRRAALVVAGALLVHQAASVLAAGKPKGGGAAAGRGQTGTAAPAGALPAPVGEMITLIRDAVEAGDIELLRDAVDWNEMKPDLGGKAAGDLVSHLKALSADGSGKDVLAVLDRLLAGPPAIMPGGRDLENGRLFVWPRFCDQPPASLTGDDSAAFDALVPAEQRQGMRDAGRYTGWRLVIGADGTWHTFGKVD